MSHTPGPWQVWEGWEYEGGGADLCIGAGEEWLANMDHRTPRCPQITEDGHFSDQCDICTIDSGDITAEQRANAILIAAAPDLLAALDALLTVQYCPPPAKYADEWRAAVDAGIAAIEKATTVPALRATRNASVSLTEALEPEER